MRLAEVRVMSEVRYVSVSINNLTAIRSRDGQVTVAAGEECDEPVWAGSTADIRAVLDVLDAACAVADGLKSDG